MTKAQILLEQIKNSFRLQPNVRKKINRDLAKLTSGKYFESIPNDSISKILKEYGLIILQEDGTEWSGFLLGVNSRAHFDVGYIETKNSDNRYTAIDNVALVMSWYRMPSGRYEIVVYLG
jgi:hypothetical protein